MLRREFIWLVGVLALAGLLGCYPGAPVDESPSAHLTYTGSFRYDDGSDYTASLKLESSRTSGDQLEFRGTLVYAPGDYRVTVDGRADLSTGKIEMWESEPNRPGMVLNGRHVGTISPDLQSIQTAWLSHDHENDGRLELRAPLNDRAK
ncbi:MAG: hypothetical protein HY319_15065 [Armatimonadetes bacterium]|nr:hypothetical protein [Armatimonadota bacterium]